MREPSDSKLSPPDDNDLQSSDVRARKKFASSHIRYVVLLYLFFSGWWVLFTDRMLGLFAHSVREHQEWSIYKGYFFVAITGCLLYLFGRWMALEFDRVSDSFRMSEKKYRDLVNHSPDAIYISRGGRVVFVNATALRIFGADDPGRLLGKTPWELYHPDCHALVARRLKAIEEGRMVLPTSQKIVRLDGNLLDVEVSVVAFADDEGPAAVVILRDITERIRQETEIRRLTRLYAVLSQVNQAITRVHTPQALFEEACRIVIRDGEFRLAWLGQVRPDTAEVVRVACAGEWTEAQNPFRVFISCDRPEGQGIVASSIREGQPVAANDYLADPRMRPWWPVAEQLGFRSAISLPLRSSGVVCAALVVFSGERDCFRDQELALLKEVAADISFALDHMEQEALRREAQLAFQKSEEQLRLLIEHLDAGVIVYSPDGHTVMANPQAARLLGVPREELIRPQADQRWRFTDEAGQPLERGDYPFARVIERRRLLEQHILGIAHGSGEVKTWVLVNAYPEFENERTLRQVVVTFVDMTERKRMIESLAASEEKFRMLFDASRDAIILIKDERQIDGNTAAVKLFGCSSKAEFLAMPVEDFYPAIQSNGYDSGEEFKRHIKEAFSGRRTLFECTARRRNGAVFAVEISLSPLELRGDRILQAVLRDISWRKETEKHLRQLSLAVEQSPSTVVITDTKGNIEYANPKFTAITGYTLEEALGKNLRMLKSGETPVEEYRNLWAMITAGKEWRGIFHNKKKNGELFWEAASISPILDGSGKLTHFVAVKEDITERKQMEEKILRAQRMESIGSLAGGMAHDLNNILAPIMMSVSMLKEEDLPEDLRAQLVTGIEDAVQRGADIVSQVLTFARGARGKHVPLNIASLAKQVGQFVRETFPKSVAFSLNLPEKLWNISGDPTQLYQVLLNLCVNARDAMPQGGTLRLQAENCELGEHSGIAPEARPGRYVKIVVADTGMGIAHAIADRIFDPFFTTKEPGKGTGLGLSTVIGILRSHGGFVTVESEPGRGAAFQIYVPATTEEVEPAGEQKIEAVSQGHGETILIVDDEVDILGILKMVLEQNGWKVVCATDGVEGLAAYLNDPEQIKAVLTDMVMPNMDGLSLIRAIRKLDPRLPVLVATGYGNESSLDELNELQISAFLRKPFNGRIVQAKVAEALYGKPEQA